MSRETNDYGFVAIDEGGGEITLCDNMGGGVTPRLVAALEAVAGLHCKSPIYDTWVEDCTHDFECDGVEGGDGYSYCPESVVGYTCSECAELNKDNADGDLPSWPCPTITAVVAALGGGE